MIEITKQQLQDYELSKSFSSYYYTTRDSIITTSGKSSRNNKLHIYCEAPKWLGRTLEEDDLMHDVMFWRCHECSGCKHWRYGLITTKIEDKFSMLRGVNRGNLYEISIKDIRTQGFTARQIIDKLKYQKKKYHLDFNNLMYAYDKLTFNLRIMVENRFDVTLLEGLDAEIYEIKFSDVGSFVGFHDTYRFLGKFYKVGSYKPTNSNMPSTDNLDTFIQQAETAFKQKEYCKCGIEWRDHRLVKITEWELLNEIKVIPEYEKEFEELKTRYYGDLAEQQKLEFELEV